MVRCPHPHGTCGGLFKQLLCAAQQVSRSARATGNEQSCMACDGWHATVPLPLIDDAWCSMLSCPSLGKVVPRIVFMFYRVPRCRHGIARCFCMLDGCLQSLGCGSLGCAYVE